MSSENSAATLTLEINTETAQRNLDALEKKYAQLRDLFGGAATTPKSLAEMAAGAREADASLVTLQARVASLQAKLEKGASRGTGIFANVTGDGYALQGLLGQLDRSVERTTHNLGVMLKSAEMSGAEAVKQAKEIARAKNQSNAIELRLIAAEEVTKLKAALKAAQDLAKWLALTDKQRASVTVQAAKALYGGAQQSTLPGVAGSSQALAAAQTAGSVASAEAALSRLTTAHKALVSPAKESADHQLHWNKVANEGHAAARGLAGSLGTLWITYGSLAPLLAGAALGAAFKQTAMLGSEFAYQLTFVKALGDESADTMSRISSAAKTLGQSSMQGPVELASGFRVLAQAGLSGSDSILAMASVLDLAVVGEMEMAQAGTTLVGVMNAFSLSVNSASHVGDVFAKAAALSQTSVQGMTEAMKTASVVGEQYGASLEDTATALTLLAKVNIVGTTAGTALRNMLKELYSPTAGAAAVFKQLGVSAGDADGKLKDFPTIIYELRKQLEDFDKPSQVNILQKMFGERGAKEAVAMLALTRSEWDKLNASISQSSGFMRQVSAELEDTTKGTFIQAMSAMQAAFVSVFDTAEGPMKDMAIRLKGMFSSAEFRSNVAATVTLLSSVAAAVLSVTSAASTLVSYLPDGSAGFGLWVVGLSALIPKLLALGAATTAASVAVAGIGGASAAAATAGLSAVGASAAATASLGFGPLIAALGLVTAGYVLFSSKTPAVISGVNALNSSLESQIVKLRLINGELQRKNTLSAGGGDLDITRAQRELGLAEGKLREYNAKIAKSREVQSGSILTGQSAKVANDSYISAAEARKHKAELEKNIKEARLNVTIAEGYEDQNRIEGNRAAVTQQLKDQENLSKLKAGTKQFSSAVGSKSATSGKPRGELKDQRAIQNDSLSSTLKREQIKLGSELVSVEVELSAQTISAAVAQERKNAATIAELEVERQIIAQYLKKAESDNDALQFTKFQNDLDENALAISKARHQAGLDLIKVHTADQNTIENTSIASQRYVEDLQFEIEMLGKTTVEVAKLRVEREALRSTENLQLLVDRNQVNPGVAEALQAEIDARKAAQLADAAYQESYVGGWAKARDAWLKDATSAAKQAQSAFEVMSRAMENALDEFLTTGKLNFADFARSIILDMAKIEAKALMAQASTSLGGGSGFGGIVKGILGMLGMGGGGNTSTTSVLSAGGVANSTPFAKGGVFSGAPSLHAYANTVQTSPTPFAYQNLHGFAKGGVFAEAGPEAVMPIMQSELGRDRQGRLGIKRQAASDTINITVHVNGNASAPDVRRSAAQGAREGLAAFNGARRYA
jgi:TP901 family phage tail tape measure protein/lambda family phage tail tape measure protein